jgi:lysozyme family protein
MQLTDKLAEEYQTLFDSCITRDEYKARFHEVILGISYNKNTYINVAKLSGNNIPWYFIAAIHSLESSLNFKTHLHNGDPLTSRTIHIPVNRPSIGKPPFSWAESAIDAIRFKKLDSWTNWTISGMLYKLEEYNGWGYRKYHPDILSPYLWSSSNHYTSGKYTSDGHFSRLAISQQVGGALIIKYLY